MRKASRQIVFINTSPPEERVELLKPLSDIQEMDDDCKEIYIGGFLKLEDLTLADWAAWYDFSGKPYVKPSNDLDINGLPLESCIQHHKNDDDLNDDKVNENQCGKTKKRNKARIIRSV